MCRQFLNSIRFGVRINSPNAVCFQRNLVSKCQSSQYRGFHASISSDPTDMYPLDVVISKQAIQLSLMERVVPSLDDMKMMGLNGKIGKKFGVPRASSTTRALPTVCSSDNVIRWRSTRVLGTHPDDNITRVQFDKRVDTLAQSFGLYEFAPKHSSLVKKLVLHIDDNEGSHHEPKMT
eukprot:GILJ01009280.1.p2 GENE.GILJ01009280.1~~GILJ01009280.1.p2  ORF type:complete len:178 (-),score=16.31 GILJ01009280.1:31-564(-)